MPPAEVRIPRGRGRPRDPAIDEAVLRATTELLAEVNYKGLTFDAIMERSGAARPTIYLRWASKAHLVYDAVFGQEPPAIGDSGDLAADVRAFVEAMVAHFDRPEVRPAYLGLMGEVDQDATIEIRSGWVSSRAAMERRLETAITRGEVRPEADLDFVLSCINGTIIHHLVVLRSGAAGLVNRLTEMLLETELRRPLAR